jgi:hypothetical protein
MTRRNLTTAKRKSSPEHDPIVRRAVIRIRKLDKVMVSSGKRFLAAVMQQGKELERLRERVGAGWLDFLRRNRKKFPWSDDTVTNRINVSRVLRERRFRSLRNQPFEVLCAIGRRSVPDEARVTFAKRAATGERITTAEVRHEVRRIGHRTSASIQPKSITAEDMPAASTRLPLTAEYFEAVGRRQLVDAITDFAGKLPSDRSSEQARAIIESANAAGRRDSFTLAVEMLDEFIGELQRQIKGHTPTTPTLQLIHGKDD